MRFSILKQLGFTTVYRADAAVERDADELMQTWGSAAYDRAVDLSWREDSGLVHSPKAGHWWAVRREIGRRLGQPEREPSPSSRRRFALSCGPTGHQQV